MANLLDLPPEILLHILTCFVPSVPLSRQAFWLLAITPHTLLTPNSNVTGQKDQRGEQIRIAKSLSLICWRTWTAFMPFVWSRFDCPDLVAWIKLRSACESERELGSHVQ